MEDREIDANLQEIARLLSSEEVQSNKKFTSVQALVGVLFSLQQAFTAADSALLSALTGDAVDMAAKRNDSITARAESFKYLATWVRAELGVENGDA